MVYPENTRVTLRLTPEQFDQYKADSKKHLSDFRASLDKAIKGVAFNDQIA
jgi:hypothetical protein